MAFGGGGPAGRGISSESSVSLSLPSIGGGPSGITMSSSLSSSLSSSSPSSSSGAETESLEPCRLPQTTYSSPCMAFPVAVPRTDCIPHGSRYSVSDPSTSHPCHTSLRNPRHRPLHLVEVHLLCVSEKPCPVPLDAPRRIFL